MGIKSLKVIPEACQNWRMVLNDSNHNIEKAVIEFAIQSRETIEEANREFDMAARCVRAHKKQ